MPRKGKGNRGKAGAGNRGQADASTQVNLKGTYSEIWNAVQKNKCCVIIFGLFYALAYTYCMGPWEVSVEAHNEHKKEMVKKSLTVQELFDAAKDQSLIDELLKPNWIGLKAGIDLVVGQENSTILRKMSQISGPPAQNAQLDPVDVGPFIDRVLKASSKTFLIVDGMKGCGKSTAMLLLCSHVLQQGRAAVHLKLAKSPNTSDETKQFSDSFIDNPSSFVALARHYNEKGELTIVLDDFQTYLKSAGEDTVRDTVEQLWLATSMYSARVIFTTSDYSLRESLTRLIRHSLRMEDVRLDPPPVLALAKMIKTALVAMGTYNNPGNSDRDIEIYCEVVGTFRDVLLRYIQDKIVGVSSVRDVTRQKYDETLRNMKTALVEAPDNDYEVGLSELLNNPGQGRLLKNLDQKHWNNHCKDEIAQSEKCRELSDIVSIVDDQRADLNAIMDGIIANGTYTVRTREGKIASYLQARNVLRHVPNEADTVEFHSYVEEVAVRALLMTPTNDTQGHGRPETLEYLKTAKTVRLQEEVCRELKRT